MDRRGVVIAEDIGGKALEDEFGVAEGEEVSKDLDEAAGSGGGGCMRWPPVGSSNERPDFSDPKLGLGFLPRLPSARSAMGLFARAKLFVSVHISTLLCRR